MTTTVALLLFCAIVSCHESQDKVACDGASCEDSALLQRIGEQGMGLAEVSLLPRSWPRSDGAGHFQDGAARPDGATLLQDGASHGTQVPWCRPRLCWSPYHQGSGPQGDRPLCADALFDLLVSVGGRLTDLGFDWQICHGTLLGAIRDNDIIPWTADVDICLRNESWHRFLDAAVPFENSDGWWASDLPERPPLRTLTPQWLPGYAFGFLTSDSVTTIRGCEDSATQDWHLLNYQDSRVVYMDISDCDRDPWPDPHMSTMRRVVAEPKRMVMIRDRAFPAPRDAEIELEVLYGSGWRTPDRQHSSHGGWRR
jgi:hypothetical protein